MNREEILRNLEYAYEKLKDKPTFTGEINVGCMISDVISFINKSTELQALPAKPNDSISRQALIDEVLDDGNGAVLSYTAGMDEDELVERIEKQMIKHFISVIEHAPTVESNRPKGEWIKRSSVGNWECSLCGNDIITSEQKLANYKYCPNCGADMRGNREVRSNE